jgi:hypothetical protein
MFAVEGHADTNASVVLHTLTGLIVRIFFLSNTLISLALNDQPTTTSWNQTLEDRSKLLGDLFESSLDGLILSLIQDLDKVLDRRLRIIKFLSSLQQAVSLSGEVVVLFECLLVDMLVFLERIIDFLEFGRNL